MARVAIVSYDVQTIFGKAGGVGAFTTRLANLLRQAGESVTIVMTRCDMDPLRVDVEWRARFQSAGIDVIEVQSTPPSNTRWPDVPTMRVSEHAAPVLRAFDVVYFQDWGNPAFHLVRQRRYSADRGPVCVTVLHGPSEWELSSNKKYPNLPGDLHLAYQERYAARHSDLVVSPSRYMGNELKDLGWVFPGDVEALGLPMPEPAQRDAAHPASSAPIRRIVYFGRLEERKGIRNFVKALQHLAPRLDSKPEVVLLGATPEQETQLTEFALKSIRNAGFTVSHQGSLNSDAAQAFLRQAAAETLCVVPSPADNFPYAVIEASLVLGLNLIVTDGGGVPEILPGASDQIAGAYPLDLAAKIAERLLHPLAPQQLARYDCAAANQRWLAFHARAVALAADRTAPAAAAVPPRRLSVDVCVTYYQKPAHFGQLVDALERQTDQDFHVIAVNDGSPDEESNRVFEQCAARTKSRGWDFFRQENAFVDAARNNAARRGSAELLLFVDGDDVPAHHAVARLREAIARSGDDALIPAMYLFASDGAPFDPATGEVRVPAFAVCVPLGIDLVGGLINPCAFGGSMFLVRRSVFEQMGGFRELRGVGSEDWEFYVRLALAGHTIDILPEVLHFYRQVEGSLARTLPAESSTRRILDAYEDSLRPLGLQGAALALSGLHRAANALEYRIAELQIKVDAPRARYAFFPTGAQRFEMDAVSVERLRTWYRNRFSMETRLRLHRVFLQPLFGPYKGHQPPPA
jgi:glycosyltransferase involved in cell wall biosynthesis